MSVFTSLLNGIFAVYKPQKTADGQGGWITSYASVGSVAGRMRPRGGRELDVADSEEQQVPHVLYVKATDAVGMLIGREWLITDADGRNYTVQGVREPSLAGKHLEIDCMQRQLAANEVLTGS